MIAVIDNYDSFTYNLVQYLGELGAQVCVSATMPSRVEEAGALDPSHIVISPGPGEPFGCGHFREVIRSWGRAARCWASAWATSASAKCLAGRWCARRA
jgi:anthranilate synthase component II